MNKTGIIILAAGSSSRLGRPKQLLPYRGTTMLSHVIAESLAASLEPVVVVTGAHHAKIHDSLEGQLVEVVFNPAWETGIASGIVTGLAKILSLQPHLQAVMVAVCDQPYISSELFRLLPTKQSESGKGLIACAYSGIAGTPVLFDRRYFNELSMLAGDAGARHLLRRYPDDVATIPFPEGRFDIDTEEDFQQLSGQMD
jgi:molybdenum cofactor cytidylyltransferase